MLVACASTLRPVVQPALRPVPRMTADGSRDTPLSTAVFGMGCFWAPQEAFEQVPGVKSAVVGFASVEPMSSAETPSYFSVCAGNGYTEAVEVTFDENVVSFESLLKVFWSNHDASVRTPGKEDQYRSALWVTNAAQRKLALSDVERAAAAYAAAGKPPPGTIVAESPPSFSPAERYHQSFWLKARLKLGASARSSSSCGGLLSASGCWRRRVHLLNFFDFLASGERRGGIYLRGCVVRGKVRDVGNRALTCGPYMPVCLY